MPTNVHYQKPQYDNSDVVQGKGMIVDAGAVYKAVFADGSMYDISKTEPFGDYVVCPSIPFQQTAYIKLSFDNTQIWSFKPWGPQTYLTRFMGFRSDDGVPKIERRDERPGLPTKSGKGTWTLPAADVFYGQFRIVGKTPWAGMLIEKEYEYVFVPQAGTNLVDLDGRQSPVKEVQTLMEVVGKYNWMTDSLDWNNESILPQLEALLEERNGLSAIKVVNGWTKEMTAPMEGIDYDNDPTFA